MRLTPLPISTLGGIQARTISTAEDTCSIILMGGAPSISTLVGSSKFTFVPLIMSFTNGRGKNHGILTELGYTDKVYDGVGVVVVVVVLTGIMMVVVVAGGSKVVVDVESLTVVVVVGSTDVVVGLIEVVVVDELDVVELVMVLVLVEVLVVVASTVVDVVVCV